MSSIASASVSALQNEVIEEFETLQDDHEQMLSYIIDMGEKLPPMPPRFKTDLNVIQGCMSKVWLTYSNQEGRLFFQADSNTIITKGLISILLRILSGQKIDDIINANLHFVQRIGLTQILGSQRSGGFASMVKSIKLIAIQEKGNA